MPLSEQRWNRVSESAFPWEREALEYLRTNLPDADTYRAWSNFTFIAGDGTINEVDALIVTPQGVFLIEIKSHPGILTGDRGTWTFHSPEGNVKTIDNPLFLADRKAKRLKSLLLGSKALQNVYIEPLIFLSNPTLSVQIPEADRVSICQRDIGKTPGIIAAIKSRLAMGLAPTPRHLIDRPFLRHLESAMQSVGIRPSQSLRKVGDYNLQDPLGEGPNGAWQDWSATHVSIKKDIRRIRIYNYTRVPPADPLVVKAAATREYEILRSLDHSGILKATGYTENERGPALFFSRETDETRLDFYLNQNGAKLSLDRRLDFIRQIADALRYAHSRRIVHRALSPECILVTQLESARSQLRIFNWQAGRELSSTTGATQRSSLTVDPRDFLEQSSAVYLAPEALNNPQSRTEPMDIFSLGAIAYHILSNQRPAANLYELDALLGKHKGLPLPAVVNAPSEKLQLLIRESTNPEVGLRVASATEFLDYLTEAEEELTSPNDSTIKNPLDARTGDRLPGGLTVKARLGSGGTAIAFLVEEEKSKRDVVLKLAIKPEHNDRIRDELAALTKLDHPFIVKPRSELLTIDGHAAFLMDRAGESTLAAYLRKDRLSLDLLGRFGEDLLDALTHLETMGIPHRDLKPDNIGVHKYGRNDETRLKLFDFSLSNLPLDQKHAGTPPYSEPFLLLKERKRWDPHADRFSAAQMLYEMATGTMPRWGDGQSAAHLIKDEATIESNLIDAPVRDDLTRFFTKALRRNPADRFESAEDMRFAWHSAFSDAKVTESRPAEPVARQSAIATATLETPLMLLSLGTRAENVLARENINTVAELLAVPLNRVLQMRGVGNKTRNEIVAAVRELRVRFPEAPVTKPAPTKTAASKTTVEPEVESAQTIDAIASRLTAARNTKAKTEREVTLAFLDLAHPNTPVPAWSSQSDIARTLHTKSARAQVSQIIVKARDRWSRDPAITKVRDLIAEQLDTNSGFLETSEASSLLLGAYGSDADAPTRNHYAIAVLRAAVETERTVEAPRFTDRRYDHATLILGANAAALIPWTDQLSHAARELAHATPLPAPQRVPRSWRRYQPTQS